MLSLAGLLPMLLLCHVPLLRRTADRVCPVLPAGNDGSSAPSWLRGSGGGSAPPQRLRTWVWAVRHGEAEHNLDPVRGWKIPGPVSLSLSFSLSLSLSFSLSLFFSFSLWLLLAHATHTGQTQR